MTREILRRSSAPREALADALREGLKEWKESAIPLHLRESGVLRVAGRVSSTQFELWLERSGRPTTAGTLKSEFRISGNGSEIVASGTNSLYQAFMAPVFLAAAAFALARGDAIWPFFVVVGLALVVGHWWARSDSSDNAEVRFLTQRLDAAIARAEQATASQAPAT
jgi:hypothetical protein